jgi:hypothetical protein
MPPDAPRPLAERLTRGELQGYLSLSLMAVLFAIPYLPFGFTPFGTALGLAVLILILTFGIRGVRYRRSGGRVAALLTLSMLLLTMTVSVVIVCLDFLRDMDRTR